MLTAAQLQSLLHYDPLTGTFIWKVSLSNRAPAGSVAGRRQRRRRYISIDGVETPSARLAWLYMTGEWPLIEVDHKDRDPSNDRWGNLRLATRSQNMANTGLRPSSQSKWKGVSWDKNRGLWQTGITVNLKRRSLGRYDCPVAAHLAYVLAAAKAFGEFACTG